MTPEEKQQLLDEIHPEYKHSSPRAKNRLIRHILPAILFVSAVVLLWRKAFVCPHHHTSIQGVQFGIDEEWLAEDKHNKTKVSLEAHIMSKCPDAQECLQMLVVPAMVQVSDMIDFRLSYIGSIDPDSDDVHCMHGPAECLGNIIQLCAQEVYPKPKQYLGFSNCMIADYPKIPDRELVENCALEYGIDFKQLNSCISQEGEGMDLLRESVKRSQVNHVTKSCTVRLAGKVRCIRDGGEWIDCADGSEVSDLVDDIKKLYKKSAA